MEGEEYLASRHREVVTEFIEAVVEEWAGDMGQVERNWSILRRICNIRSRRGGFVVLGFYTDELAGLP